MDGGGKESDQRCTVLKAGGGCWGGGELGVGEGNGVSGA